LKVAPVLMPGRKLGTIDVEFRVKDNLPLHGSLELNNRSSHDTTDLRLNGGLRYDNLWQKEHSLGVQYQTSPEDTEEVALVTATYNMPSFLDDDHMIALYGVWSDSDTATAENIEVIGKGTIFGGRYMMNLAPLEGYLHHVILGVDRKDFEEDIEGDEKPVRYWLWSISYGGIFPHKSGQTRFGLGINGSFRSLGSDDEYFENKRNKAQGNFFYITAELERIQKLWGGFHLVMTGDAQLANQPLISNEQYTAGGVNSVRGYKQSEASGDNAFHGTMELSSPNFGQLLNISKYFEFTPYLFYDVACLELDDSLPGENVHTTLQGAGAGARGYVYKHIAYQLDWAKALEETGRTDKGDNLFHLMVRFEF
jgi:hemolysin activation/secretion protein